MKEPATRIRVRYDDEVFEEYHAADTLKVVIGKLIGKFGKEQVLQADRSLRSPYQQRLVATLPDDFCSRTYDYYENIYISRDWNNKDKKRILEDIARNLRISMIIEVVSK